MLTEVPLLHHMSPLSLSTLTGVGLVMLTLLLGCYLSTAGLGTLLLLWQPSHSQWPSVMIYVQFMLFTVPSIGIYDYSIPSITIALYSSRFLSPLVAIALANIAIITYYYHLIVLNTHTSLLNTHSARGLQYSFHSLSYLCTFARLHYFQHLCQ